MQVQVCKISFSKDMYIQGCRQKTNTSTTYLFIYFTEADRQKTAKRSESRSERPSTSHDDSLVDQKVSTPPKQKTTKEPFQEVQQQQQEETSELHDGDPGPLRLPTYVTESTMSSMGPPYVAQITPQNSTLDEDVLQEEEAEEEREPTPFEVG